VLGANRRQGIATTAYCPIALGRVAKDPLLGAIAAAHRKTAVQVTLRWLIQQGDVIAIPRTSRVKRLAENLAVFDFELSPAEMDRIGGLRTNRHLVNEPEWVPAWD
jgi:2,5-diketo-D-gluconate reductase B